MIGKQEEAIRDSSASIRLHPTVNSYFIRAASYFELGEYDRAISDLNDAIALDATDPACWQERGLVYTHLGEYSKALADLTHALELDPATRRYAWSSPAPRLCPTSASAGDGLQVLPI